MQNPFMDPYPNDDIPLPYKMKYSLIPKTKSFH